MDDKKFAKDWINHRLNFSSMGRRRIQLELWKKRVKEGLISKEISKISQKKEVEKAQEIAERKYRTYKDENRRKRKERLISFLQRKGYFWEVIEKVLDRLKL